LPVRWRAGDSERTGYDSRLGSDAGARTDAGPRAWRAGTDASADATQGRLSGGESTATSGSAGGRYAERVYDSDELVWRTRAPAPTPIPRVAGTYSPATDSGLDRALSRARLERANGNAPLVGGVGAIAGGGTRLAAPGAGRIFQGPASQSRPVDNARVLERYQPSAADAQARGKPIPTDAQSPAELRGARAKYASTEAVGGQGDAAQAARKEAAATRPTTEATKQATKEGRAAAASEPATRRAAATDATTGDARRRAAARELEGLRRSRPAAAERVERRSQVMADAARASTRIVAGAAIGSWTGCSTGWWWADSWNECGWYKPWWTWHMTWSQCWGFGWGFGWSSHWWRPSCWTPCHAWSYPSWCWYPSVVWIERDEPLVVERVVEREVVRETIIEAEPADEHDSAARAAEPAAPEAVVQALHAVAKQHIDEGDRAFLDGRYADAVHHYARAVECSPTDGALHLVLADALFATGDYHYCAWSLRRAFELEPALFDARVDKHAFHRDPAEFDRHLALAEGFLEDHFLDDDARLVLAANYHWARRHGDCVQLLESAFSVGVRDSACGARILARAQEALEER
jgi:hypothetical protein